MFERFRRNDSATDGAPFARGDGYDNDTRTVGDNDTRAVGDNDTRTVGDNNTRTVDDDRAVATRTQPAATTTGATTVAEARELQRERFGGADGTAIFFGWLSALGLAALLVAVFAAAGTQLGFATQPDTNDATNNAGTIGIVGAAILVGILLIAYYGGGYVAGRMARFDGARQGFRVWVLGLLVTIAAAVAGWLVGSEYNVLESLNLPRIPVDEGDVTTGAIITLAAVLLGTLLAAVAGGKAGDRYHLRVDRAGWDDNRLN